MVFIISWGIILVNPKSIIRTFPFCKSFFLTFTKKFLKWKSLCVYPVFNANSIYLYLAIHSIINKSCDEIFLSIDIE